MLVKISKMRFTNLSDLPKPDANQSYITNSDGWDYIECFRSYNVVEGDYRKAWMFASLNNLICLNPSITVFTKLFFKSC